MERQETEPQNLPEEQEIHVEDICKNFLASMVQMLQVGCEIEEVEHTFTLTPLDIAILNGDVESAALLLARGANPDHLLSTLALFDLYQCISALRPDKKYIKDVLDHDKHLNVNQSFLSAHIPTRLLQLYNFNIVHEVITQKFIICNSNNSFEYKFTLFHKTYIYIYIYIFIIIIFKIF